ncbi:hypothetical protein GVN18_35470 [Pseudomonas sp. ODNR1LW]|nr:hypothetical protein [Pseudomonas sp. ODNR1LW]
MHKVLIIASLIVSGCATSQYEAPLSEKQRSDLLATLPANEREPFETLNWAHEVDPRPIVADFNACLDREISRADASLPGLTAAALVADTCFPIVERLVRGIAMRVPALMTGPTADVLNSWADSQAAKQKAELVEALEKRIEEARTGALPVQ